MILLPKAMLILVILLLSLVVMLKPILEDYHGKTLLTFKFKEFRIVKNCTKVTGALID